MLISLMLGSVIGVTSVPPVKLGTCEVTTPVTIQQDNGPMTVGTYDLRVRFANASQQQIARVTFTLDDGTTVSDMGSFSPGITIDHMLGLHKTQASSCSVTAVQFADGTTWGTN